MDRSTLALRGATGYLLASTETINAGKDSSVEVSWRDEADQYNTRNQSIGPAGQVKFEYVQHDDGNGTLTQYGIDYVHHQYQESTATKITPRKPYENDATDIAKDLAAGADTVVGMATIDGRATLQLSNDEPGMNRQIWVDPTTYLPVRMTANGSWGNYVTDYAWTPRTPQTIDANFVPTVPAGFTKVAKITES